MASLIRIIGMVLVFGGVSIGSLFVYRVIYPDSKLMDGIVAPLISISMLGTMMIIFKIRKSEDDAIELVKGYDSFEKAANYAVHLILGLSAGLWWYGSETESYDFAAVSMFGLYLWVFNHLPERRLELLKSRSFLKLSLPVLVLSTIGFFYGVYR